MHIDIARLSVSVRKLSRAVLSYTPRVLPVHVIGGAFIGSLAGEQREVIESTASFRSVNGIFDEHSPNTSPIITATETTTASTTS
jgi:hypothetical protein